MSQDSQPEMSAGGIASEPRALVPPDQWKDTVDKIRYYGFDLAQTVMETIEGRDVKENWEEALGVFETIDDTLNRAQALVGAWQTFPSLPEQYDPKEVIRFSTFSDLVLDILARTPIDRTMPKEDDQVITKERQICQFESALEQAVSALRVCQLLSVTGNILTHPDQFPVDKRDLLVATAEVFETKKEQMIKAQTEPNKREDTNGEDNNQVDQVSTALMKLPLSSESRDLVTGETYASATELVTSGTKTAWEGIGAMMNDLHTRAKDITGIDSKTMQEKAREKGIVK